MSCTFTCEVDYATCKKSDTKKMKETHADAIKTWYEI